ncbi:MAG: hypothetical protein HC871_08245 [Rhizobiales bacterium]|nr:hypothetical protein [Hyphomicrobiales bacterium]
MQHDASNQSPIDSVFRRVGGNLEDDARGFRLEPLLGITFILGCVTIGQRFAVPFDESQFGIGFLLCLLTTMMLALSGRLTIDPFRVILYAIGMGGCLLTLFFKRDAFSFISLLMLLVVYVSYVFSFRISYLQYRQILGAFQDIMLFCVWCGIAQFLIQFPLSPDFMFPFDMILPQPLFIPEFNLRIPITESLPYEKSTGLWFLEPSHFSQFLAFAVIIELRHFNRPKRLILYLGAMGLCFSGTGLVLLTMVGAILAVVQGRIGLIVLAILGFLSILLFKDVFPFSVFYERLSDFSNPLASGSGRFIAPYWVIADLIETGRSSLLLWGVGPGQLKTVVENTDFFVQDSSWFKLVIEYGCVAVVFFGLFFLISLFRTSPDRILSVACLVQFLFLGGYLLSFYVHFLYLVLVVWPELVEDEEPHWAGVEDGAWPETPEGAPSGGHGAEDQWADGTPQRRDDDAWPASSA